MAKLDLASPREITSPFTREIISVIHSKACNNSTLTRVISYILYVCLSYVILTGRRNHVDQARARSKSVLGGKIRPMTPVFIHFDDTLELL